MNHYLRAFVISFFLTGCGNHLVFEPNKLPDGYIDQEYYVPITISGGTGPVVELSYEINPCHLYTTPRKRDIQRSGIPNGSV
ncbi:hypothetical protein VBR23_12000, partial [Klebsiella pneumoniae]|nr:hypothetical protein [Klebsiella pneumoniae]